MPRADIEDVIRRHEDELMNLPGVVGVGVGRRAGQPAVELLVSSGGAGESVPSSLEGYKVQVRDAGIPSAQERDEPR